MSHQFEFPSRLRIKSRKDIEFLFENGQSLFSHPLLLKYSLSKLPEGSEGIIQFAVSVPKKLFRKAHERNTLKRRIREAYRLNWKNYLTEVSDIKILLMFILIKKEDVPFVEFEKCMKQLLAKLKSSLGNSSFHSDAIDELDPLKTS